MGTVFRKSVTRALPAGAEIIVRKGIRLAQWRDRTGKLRTAPVTVGQESQVRIATRAVTFTAKYRDGEGCVREVATGCREEQAARRVLADLERRAELVKAQILSPMEDAVADQARRPLMEHFADYQRYLQARQTSEVRRLNMQNQFDRVCRECGFKRLPDLDATKLTAWLVAAEEDGMGAATRNGYRETFVMFANWCCRGTRPRLTANPFTTVPKANVKLDRRRTRRALTAEELLRLLHVATLRPLADYGRASVPKAEAEKRGRATWTRAALTHENVAAAAARARGQLSQNPALIAELEQRGRERALIYKTLVLTGLRKSELASLTLSQLILVGPLPCVQLQAADEKNREGNTLPLRPDLAIELQSWIADRAPTAESGTPLSKNVLHQPLFEIPSGLLRILNRDLAAAGIPKCDERGRTVDIHAMRTSLGTWLNAAGVAPRTAQAALRHSTLELTMNVYTDPKLLDIQAALGKLPALPLAPPASGPLTVAEPSNGSRTVAPTVAPTPVFSSPEQSSSVHSASSGDFSQVGGSLDASPDTAMKKALPAVVAGKASEIERTGRRLNFSPLASKAGMPRCGGISPGNLMITDKPDRWQFTEYGPRSPTPRWP